MGCAPVMPLCRCDDNLTRRARTSSPRLPQSLAKQGRDWTGLVGTRSQNSVNADLISVEQSSIFRSSLSN